MAREWSLSRWVRLYVVESADEAAWEWQARCVWPLLIKAADRAGVIETTKGAKGLAAVIHMPLDVVTPAVEELLADGCLVTTARGYLLRNYFEAQNAEMAGSLRQAEYKARKRASAALGESDCNGAHSEVTRGDTGSRTVTPGDAEVTRGDSEQSRAELSRTEKKEPGSAAPALVLALDLPEPVKPLDAARVATVEAITRLNLKTGRRFDAGAVGVVKDIRACLKAGLTVTDLLAVVDDRCTAWLDSPKRDELLKPSVLFRPSNAQRYLAESRAGPTTAHATPINGRPRALGQVPISHAPHTDGEQIP